MIYFGCLRYTVMYTALNKLQNSVNQTFVNCYINGMHHLQPTPPSSRPIQQPPVTSRLVVEKQQTGELSLCSMSGLSRSVCKTSASLTAQPISSIYCSVECLSGSFSCKRGVMHFCVFLMVDHF